MATCVIVDGNNLAHYLYNLGPNRSIPLEIDAQLVEALGVWANNQNREIEVELCLDARREKPAGNKWVKVFTADPGHQADGMVVGKVIHRVYDGDACLVITSDEELQARVAEFQVRCIGVRDFVLPVNSTSPTFAPLPARILKGTLPLSTIVNSKALKPLQKEIRGLKRRRTASLDDEYDRLIAQTLAARNNTLASSAEEGSWNEPASVPLTNASQEIQIVHLTLSTWPLLPGGKFLKESFCPVHYPEVSGIFKDSPPLNLEDLPVLAEFLLGHCGSEADFIQRGGCLMDRVRLALMQASGMQLTFQEIAALTGDSLSDIRRKARQSAGRWVKIETVTMNTRKAA